MSSFVHHFKAISEFKLELQSGNAQFSSILVICFVLCDLEIWRMTWKTIGHLFYATSSFVHPFIAIWEIKMELQSGNAQSGSKLTICFSHVTLKFDRWPWKIIGHPSLPTSSFEHHIVAIGKFKLELQLVRKCPIRVKISKFLSNVTMKFDEWPWKTIGHLFCASFHSHLWIQTGVTVRKRPI